jgi:hypothetical protein
VLKDISPDVVEDEDPDEMATRPPVFADDVPAFNSNEVPLSLPLSPIDIEIAPALPAAVPVENVMEPLLPPAPVLPVATVIAPLSEFVVVVRDGVRTLIYPLSVVVESPDVNRILPPEATVPLPAETSIFPGDAPVPSPTFNSMLPDSFDESPVAIEILPEPAPSPDISPICPDTDVPPPFGVLTKTSPVCAPEAALPEIRLIAPPFCDSVFPSPALRVIAPPTPEALSPIFR